MGAIQNNLDKARALAHYTEQARIAEQGTFCIDCGQPTTPGKGSKRCPSCWEDRVGSTVCPHLREWLDCPECRTGK